MAAHGILELAAKSYPISTSSKASPRKNTDLEKDVADLKYEFDLGARLPNQIHTSNQQPPERDFHVKLYELDNRAIARMLLDTPIAWSFLFLFGIFTGILAGLLGIGGGQIMVPALTMLGIPLVQATATSLVGVLLSSISGSLQNLRTGQLNWRESLLLAVFGIGTAQLGAWLGDRLPDTVLSLSFAALLLSTVYLMDLRQKLKRQQELIETASQPGHSPNSIGATAGIGLLAGVLSGLFGVGGGVVMVPLQMLLLSEPIKSAVRTSLGAIVAIAVSALAQHAWNNNVLWVPGLFLGLGGIVGAQAGTRLLPKLSEQLINRLFRVFLLLLAGYMVVRVF